MNISVSQLHQDLEQGTKLGAAGDNLLRWAAEEAFVTKVLSNSLLQASREKLQREANALRGSAAPVLPFQAFKLFDTVGDRRKYESHFFRRRKVLLVSALSTWLWNEPEDVVTLEECIWALCDDYTWSLPAHMHGASLSLSVQPSLSSHGDPVHSPAESAVTLDLFACETGLALAEVCALLGDKLHPFIVERARHEVKRRVIDSYMQSATIQKWELMDNNWCAVCAGSIGSAAMLLVERDLDLAAILRKLLPCMDSFLDGFNEGACTEGLTYWTYGVNFFAVFCDFLRRRTAGALDLFSDPRLAPIAAFQQHCFFGGAATLTFSDVEANVKYRPGLTCLLAEYFDQVAAPPLESAMDVMHCHTYNFAPALSDMLWTTNTLASKQAKPPACVIYREAQWLLCNGHDQTGFAAKGGHNDEQHNHNDVGSFTFSRQGLMLLCDIGSGEYTKAYFGPGRYDILCNSSQGHSVPIVNGFGQRAGREYRARNVKFDPNGAISMDIASAYAAAGLTALSRHASFDHQAGRLHLRDEIRVSRPLKVIERFISFVRPQIAGGIVVLRRGPVSCTLSSNMFKEPRISKMEHVNHSGSSVDVYSIDFCLDVVENTVFDLVVA